MRNNARGIAGGIVDAQASTIANDIAEAKKALIINHMRPLLQLIVI